MTRFEKTIPPSRRIFRHHVNAPRAPAWGLILIAVLAGIVVAYAHFR